MRFPQTGFLGKGHGRNRSFDAKERFPPEKYIILWIY